MADKTVFKCVRCGLLGIPAGHAETTGIIVKTHYVWDFKKKEFTDEVAYHDTVSKWVSHENGHCTTCDPDNNYAKGKLPNE